MKMRHLGCLILSLSSLYSGALIADSKLRLQDGVAVLAINGQELSADATKNGQLPLISGKNQILVRYSVELATGDGDMESSDTFVLLFDAADDQVLQLKAPQIKRSRGLKQFNRSGNWQLTNASGKAINYRKAVIKKEGFQLGRDYERELEQFNKTDSPAAYRFNRPVAKIATASVSEVIESDRPLTTPEGNAGADNLMTERMLKYWYNQADFKTRERFKSWISQ